MTPRRTRGRRLVLAAVAAVVLVLAGCSEVKNNGQNSLEPKGPQAQTIDDLFVPILILAIVIGIAIIVATVYLAVRYRYRPGNPAPFMVFQDGGGFVTDEGRWRAHIVFDNLIHQRQMPPTIGIFINPGVLPATSPDRQPRGQAVVVAVLLSRRQGRHRRRDGDPHRP